jgi:molybdenum ABC transporter molybdate-binding protein
MLSPSTAWPAVDDQQSQEVPHDTRPADVRAVRVGRYAKSALDKLGAWSAVKSKFVGAENVRAALLMVARNEAALGIVCATDAKVEPGVKIVSTFPANSHQPIFYPCPPKRFTTLTKFMS